MKWTDHALTQLRHIHDHIAQDSPDYPKRLTEALVSKTTSHDNLPRLGRNIPELGEKNSVREIPLYSYRILQKTKPDNLIEVPAIIHNRRDLQSKEIPREQY